jgi:hypothetical protein
MQDFAAHRQRMREAAPATSLAAYRHGSLRASPPLEQNDETHQRDASASLVLNAAASAAAPLPRALTLQEDALMRLACSGRWDELRAALNDAGARDIDVNFRFPHNLATMLHYAAASSSLSSDDNPVDADDALDDDDDDDSTVAFLLGRGADPNAVAANGSTPLHWAAESAHERCVALLAARAPLQTAETDERRRSPREVGEGGASAHTPGGKSCLALLAAAESEPFVAVEVSRVWAATAPI